MSASSACSRCGFVNLAGAKFCAKCGSPLASFTQPQTPSPPFPTPVPGVQQWPSYGYPDVMAAQNRTTEIDRTKTGLLLLLIGILFGPIPYLNYVGGLLIIIGAILVIVGRKAFGAAHSRNTILSVIIFIVGTVAVIAASVAFTFAAISAAIANSSGGTFNYNAFVQSLSSSFTTLIVGAAVGGAIIAIAQVLFTYAIQDRNGKILLWAGYAAGIAVAVVQLIIIIPQISNAASQSFNGTSYNSTPFDNLQAQERVLGLLGFIPAALYATAIYLVWARINRGEIPSPATQPAR